MRFSLFLIALIALSTAQVVPSSYDPVVASIRAIIAGDISKKKKIEGEK